MKKTKTEKLMGTPELPGDMRDRYGFGEAGRCRTTTGIDISGKERGKAVFRFDSAENPDLFVGEYAGKNLLQGIEEEIDLPGQKFVRHGLGEDKNRDAAGFFDSGHIQSAGQRPGQGCVQRQHGKLSEDVRRELEKLFPPTAEPA